VRVGVDVLSRQANGFVIFYRCVFVGLASEVTGRLARDQNDPDLDVPILDSEPVTFVHTLPLDEARAIWDAQIVPDSGLPFFQVGFSMFDRSSPTRVDFANPNRSPVLFISGDADRAMTPAVVHRMYRAHCASRVRTDLRSFPGRTHWLIAQDGWKEVAQACLDWIESLTRIFPRPLNLEHRRMEGVLM
jgi:hypothetical protein